MLGHRADDGIDYLPLVKEHEGGDARDAIALGHCGVLVDAAPSRGDDYIALDLARGMRQKRAFSPGAVMNNPVTCTS